MGEDRHRDGGYVAAIGCIVIVKKRCEGGASIVVFSYALRSAPVMKFLIAIVTFFLVGHNTISTDIDTASID